MNSFGKNFRIQLYGESHGPAVGVIVDGLPAGIPINLKDFERDISRRKPGAVGTTARSETDIPLILSGCFRDLTTGSPLHIQFVNGDIRSADYEQQQKIPRPGHADFVAAKKFGGFHDYRGGGHFSGRLTLPIVAAGVLAKKIIGPIELEATLIEAGGSNDIQKAIEMAIANQDSIGGIVECKIQNVPIGLGEPFFDSIESKLSHLIFSIPAIKGIEFGSGFLAAKMKGSQHNDSILNSSGQTQTNHAGGINGGISNGNPIIFRVAIKPTSSIGAIQESVNLNTNQMESFQIQGRHDVCIALRVPVVVEAVAAIVIADLIMESKLNKG
ncbi:MAG: chorismate synthase [Saprospiraceae bacterium]|nr:chorismate synthase [Saprospiraceae bacterium]